MNVLDNIQFRGRFLALFLLSSQLDLSFDCLIVFLQLQSELGEGFFEIVAVYIGVLIFLNDVACRLESIILWEHEVEVGSHVIYSNITSICLLIRTFTILLISLIL